MSPSWGADTSTSLENGERSELPPAPILLLRTFLPRQPPAAPPWHAATGWGNSGVNALYPSRRYPCGVEPQVKFVAPLCSTQLCSRPFEDRSIRLIIFKSQMFRSLRQQSPPTPRHQPFLATATAATLRPWHRKVRIISCRRHLRQTTTRFCRFLTLHHGLFRLC